MFATSAEELLATMAMTLRIEAAVDTVRAVLPLLPEETVKGLLDQVLDTNDWSVLFDTASQLSMLL